MRCVRAVGYAGFLSFGCTLAVHNAAAESARYSVVIDGSQPVTARVVLTLPQSADRASAVLVSGAAPLNVNPQINDVRCDGRPVDEDAGRWRLPLGCKEATWSVRIARPGPRGILASDQQSVAMQGGWYLFSEPSSLLRLASEPLGGSVISFSGPAVRSEDIQLQPRNKGPSFFVLADAPRVSVRDGALTLTYFGDDLQAVQRLVEPSKHLEGLVYLRRVMGPSTRRINELKVVWLQIANDGNVYGGAAGNDVFLVNYAADPPPEQAVKPFIITLHEQFHQIDPGGTNRPQWVSESLAQYYALKAALYVSGDDPRYVNEWTRWFRKAEKESGKLLDAQQRVRNKDFSAYKLFYSRGSMFWRDVEAALKRNGQEDGLDPVLPIILGATFGPDASLPVEVLRALSGIPESELTTLIETYL